MNDPFITFLDAFSEKNVLKALQTILASPETSYDSLKSTHSAFHALVNYVDATVFATINDALHASAILRSHLEQMEPTGKVQMALHTLRDVEMTRILLAQEDASEIPDRLLLDSWRGWASFTKKKPDFSALLGSSLTWYSFQYPIKAEPRFLLEAGDIPLIVLEPCECKWTQFLNTYKGKKALFCFESRQTFAQMLQYPEVVEALCEPEHLLYIMELYPQEQLAQQMPFAFTTFRPIVFAKRPILEAAIPLLAKALQEGNCDWAYHICKRALFCLNEWRLGKSRSAALLEKISSLNWNDPHKSLPPKGLALGPEPKDFFGERCTELAAARHPKPNTSTKKIKLAHVVPQVVEIGGHAPTRLLKNLIQYCDRDRFDLFLICTERLAFHPHEYPYIFDCSDPSSERAPSLLEQFKKDGIALYVLDAMQDYEPSAHAVANFLNSNEIDVAVFHGPDVINTLAAQMADVSLRLMLEHGTQPAHSGFDAVITSTNDALDIYAPIYKKFGIQAEALPFSVDIRASWNCPSPTKKELGLPDDSFVMTTISNHLETRLGDEMCLAIAEILKRCPKAVYAPIGPVANREKFDAFFTLHKVQDRVFFLGVKQNASHYARAMQLYLNEFPFGSCLGMLDAMASGCPVVSMYDANGPQQARYSATFFGIDRAIRSGRREEYVDLACRLIENPTMYQEWVDHALKQYEERTDVKGYVARFEEIVRTFLSKSKYVTTPPP